MKAEAAAAKKAAKNRLNFLTFTEAKEAAEEQYNTGPYEFGYYDYNTAATWGNANHPFCEFMGSCGYHSIQVVHTKTGTLAFGSYVVEKQNQLQVAADPYYAYAIDVDGSVITNKESPETKLVTEMDGLQEFVAKSQSEASFRSFLGMMYQQTKWKKVRNQERDTDKGGVSVMRGKKRRNLNTPGWSSKVENGHMSWCQYDSEGTPFGEATWDPQVEIEAGMKACVTKDSEFFYNAMGPHTNYYNNETWDQHVKEILGRSVNVVEVLENKHIALVETQIYDPATKDDKTVQWHVPGECLEGEPEGDTLLFLGEVGQFIYIAQMNLFGTDTHNPRSKNPNPLFSEYVSLINGLNDMGEDMGFHGADRVDEDGNLHPDIATWMANNSEWTYED